MNLNPHLFYKKYRSFLYVFRVKSPTCGTEYIKIGKTTTCPLDRYCTFFTGTPYILNIHMTFRFKDRYSADNYEDCLHYKMEKFSISGEWFIYNKESRKCLLEGVAEIANNHYDIRENINAKKRLIPNIDYKIGGSIFTNEIKGD